MQIFKKNFKDKTSSFFKIHSIYNQYFCPALSEQELHAGEGLSTVQHIQDALQSTKGGRGIH